MALKIIDRPSPSHGARRPKGRSRAPIDMLVLHYTGMKSARAALDRLCDPKAQVSAHYLIDRDGTIYRLVDEKRRAWHAGVSYWDGERDINSRSIGIELVNPGHEFGYRAFPKKQMRALIALARDIVKRHKIPKHRVLGHSDVAPARKIDPGEKFDWRGLARAGIGVWPHKARARRGPQKPSVNRPDIADVQRALAALGYEIAVTGRRDKQTRLVVTAFQRHFRPRKVDGKLDGETGALAQALPRH